MTFESPEPQYLKPIASERYIAVHVRPQSVGFVVVENAIVIDSGTRFCDQTQFDDCLGDRFDRLLQLYRPSGVIVKGARDSGLSLRKRRVFAAIRQGAAGHSIALISMNPSQVDKYFLRYDARTKQQIAETVAKRMPELAWKLPRRRKPWESEHHRMSIFDAAAIVIAYLNL